MPEEHGNGGWCGWKVLAHVTPKWMLSRDPVKTYLGGEYNPTFGSRLRLCKTKNANDAVYIYDHENRQWLGPKGILPPSTPEISEKE